MESEPNERPRRVRKRRVAREGRPKAKHARRVEEPASESKRPSRSPAKRRSTVDRPRAIRKTKREAEPLRTDSESPRRHERQPTKPVSSRSRLEPAPAWLAISRGVALFLGILSLLTVFGELQLGGPDGNFGWLDLRPCPPEIARGVLGLCGIGLVLFSLFPNLPDLIRSIGILATMAVLAVAVANAIQFGRMRREGILAADNDLSHSIHLIIALSVCVLGLIARPRLSVNPLQNMMLICIAFVVTAATLPLTMFACSQKTNVNYEPELVAVLGPTTVSATEQIRTGLKLLSSTDDRIVISGVANDAIPELRAKLAPLGQHAIVDDTSDSLEAAVAFAAAQAKDAGATKVAVVTDFHQLPRARILFRRLGFDAVPVPVGSFDSLPMVEHSMLSETIAYYRSYVDPLMQ